MTFRRWAPGACRANPNFTFIYKNSISYWRREGDSPSIRWASGACRTNPQTHVFLIIKLSSIWRREGDSNPRGSLWPPNRFRVDPVTTTSVPLRTDISRTSRLLSSFPEKIYSIFARILPVIFLLLFPHDDSIFHHLEH